ncbi:MAG: hypothetical protein HFI87_04065 [Bacilli bacterium]|nr:hypothetical protein [Bacilli bacterium]
MVKNLENTKIEKLPTSQLVFYMSSPELGNGILASRIEATVFSRLTKEYKLYPNVARKFIEREQEIINVRGYNIENYTFGKEMSYNELFRIFYESVELISRVVEVKANFNTLTMSEISEFYYWFSIYKNSFTKRQKMLQKSLKSNDKQQKKILKSNIPFHSKEQKINELERLQKIMQTQCSNEHSLIGYNEMLFNCMLNKLKEVMRYDANKDLRVFWTALKEALLTQKSSIQHQEKEQFGDINFDAYTYYTTLPSEYNVRGYPFSKKR